MTKWFRLSLPLLIMSFLAPLAAQTIDSDEMKSLGRQVQEVKSDVLSIASELDAPRNGCCFHRTRNCRYSWQSTTIRNSVSTL